jgi:hypothetical protein
MVKVADKFIVSKGKEWLMCDRQDFLELPHSHVYSIYVYDAKKFDTRLEAKRYARKVGGKVWTFNQATGNRKELVSTVPVDADCDKCLWYRPWDGTCRNPESEYYKEPVSYQDICEDWEAKNG